MTALFLALAAVLVLGACETAPEPAEVSDSGTVEGAAGPVAYLKVGEGPAHLVVHGGPGLDHRYLRPWLDALAEGRSLVYYDQWGLGSSVPASGELDPSTVSWPGALEDLDRLAREFAGEDGKVGLIAHSWGIYPSMAWALSHPDRVRSIVLVAPIEPGNRYNLLRRERLMERTDSATVARIEEMIGSADRAEMLEPAFRSELMREMFRMTASDPEVIDRLDLDLAPATARYGEVVARTLGGQSSALEYWGLLSGLGDVPVLIVHGSEDPTPPRLVQAIADSLPAGQAVIMDDVGHFPFAQEPRRFAEIVDGFLDEVNDG